MLLFMRTEIKEKNNFEARSSFVVYWRNADLATGYCPTTGLDSRANCEPFILAVNAKTTSRDKLSVKVILCTLVLDLILYSNKKYVLRAPCIVLGAAAGYYAMSSFYSHTLYPEDRKTPHNAQLSYTSIYICLSEHLAAHIISTLA